MTHAVYSAGGATRRGFLAASATAPLALGAGAMAQARPHDDQTARDLDRYISLGNKQSGGAGDDACGVWLEGELRAAGLQTDRQYFDVPFFEAAQAELRTGSTSTTVWPVPIVQTTPAGGITAPVVRVDAHGRSDRPLDGAIALVDLAFGRWSSMFWPGVAQPVAAAFEGGAAAVVIITNGPSGKIIALNTHGREPLYSRPVALLAPQDAAPFLAAAMEGRAVTLIVTGRGGRRRAFNLVGRLDRGRGRWLVVSTPRSGWFTCAGERGGGIAAWLHFARWTVQGAPDYDLAFVCNSGHEYQYLGAEELLHAVAPTPQETAFWLHLGANLAARDWHEGTNESWPLPGTDSQRYLVVSPHLVPAAREAFTGLAGLEAPYSSENLSAGELRNVIEAGYAPVAGVFGTHRFHHVETDDERCISSGAVTQTISAFRSLLEHALL
ncbi:twin-arginine translocation signal domain-containing protein [Glycocaulis abyssi]|uniref:Twin-arginine translocation signal domain-containing protein n=1 Tax=Glycocaulis abyssi TaxID=1433403 RepID=A0ABV9NEH7_9PROT